MRSLKKSLFKIGLFSNKWIIMAITSSLVLMLGIIYLPWFQNIFQFSPLSLMEFLLIVLVASSVFIVGEIYKFIRFRK